MIRAVFLDIDDTLLDFRACASSAMQDGFAAFSLPFREEDFSVFERINNGFWKRLERGEITREELGAQRWNEVFASLGLRSDGVAFEKRFQSLLAEKAIPVEGAQRLLSALHGRFLLCAASNAFYEQQRRRLTDSGLMPYLSHLFVSERMGAPKPSRAFFDACLASLPGIAPEEIVMVGDSLTADIAGGASYGMHTVWFNRYHAPVPDGCPAERIAGSLDEIRQILLP